MCFFQMVFKIVQTILQMVNSLHFNFELKLHLKNGLFNKKLLKLNKNSIIFFKNDIFATFFSLELTLQNHLFID